MNADISDISIYRCCRSPKILEAWSHRTSGRCATIYLNDDGGFQIAEFLSRKYMNGITTELIESAVKDFLKSA